MRILITIMLVSVITGCGGAPSDEQAVNTTSASIPFGNCLVIDKCTYPTDVLGYNCFAFTYELGNPNVPSSAFQGHSCLTTKEDAETDPSCDPKDPNEICTIRGFDYPCCKTIQGPGPAVGSF